MAKLLENFHQDLNMQPQVDTVQVGAVLLGRMSHGETFPMILWEDERSIYGIFPSHSLHSPRCWGEGS